MLQGYVGVLLDLNKKNPKNADSERAFRYTIGTRPEVKPASSPLKNFETSPKSKGSSSGLPRNGFQGASVRCSFLRFVEVEGKELF